jgi:hypothetical protein
VKGFFFILLFFGVSRALAQSIIQGHVLDGETLTPLPGANVFIANSTYGVASGTEGEFIIKGLPRAHYKLVVSFVGYDTQVIDVVPNAGLTYKIILKPSAKKLNEFVVHARRRSRSEWLANLKIFKERFIGQSENARFCTFENANVLSFDNKDGMLEAFADSTLIITNNGLGYRVKIALDKYRFNMITTIVHYEGQMVYEQIVPENDEEKVRWARNRLRAYYGSEMHFFRAVYARDLINNGFYYNLIEAVPAHDAGIQRHGIADTTLTPRSPVFNNRRIRMLTITNYNRILDSARSTPEESVLSYKGDLEVQYINEAEPGAYQHARHIFPDKVVQRSTLILHKPCVVQQPGNVYPADAVETKNYWSWELMAESLPLDYDPAVDQAIVEANE